MAAMANGNHHLPPGSYPTIVPGYPPTAPTMYYPGTSVPYLLTASGVPGGQPSYYPAPYPGQDPHGKKRRLEEYDDEVGSGATGSPAEDGRRGSVTGAAGKGKDKDDKGKRIKTVRACDSCRRKKIRCNPIDGTEPPICQHCKNHGFECTWFLPITETRFKRKSETEELGSQGNSSPAPASAQRSQRQSGDHLPPATFSMSVTAPLATSLTSGVTVESPVSSDHGRQSQQQYERRHDPRVYGPTSMSYLMHSTTSFPVDRMSAFDTKHFQKLEARDSGDGMIKVWVDQYRAPSGDDDGEADHQGGPGGNIRMPNSPDGGGSGLVVPATVAEQLVNYFFTSLVHLYPIMSREDFLSTVPLSPLLFYAICGVSAMNRKVDPAHRKAIREVMLGMHRHNEILAQSDLSTIQSLLLYSFSMEFERQRGGSLTWNALGTAIRMAQGLGLHRESVMQERADDHTELRRRIWGGCIIADRWIAAMYGLPQMIDISDCDRLFPCVHEVRPGAKVNQDRKPYAANVSMIELSIVLGRVLKTLYSPTGILNVTDELANGLLSDLNAWRDDLPPECKFSGDSSTVAGGWLHLCSVPVYFLLYRPFMRISFTCPENLTFAVSVPVFNMLLDHSREAIEWVAKHEAVLEGFPVGLYSLFVACLIQYHVHVRRREPLTLQTLGVARDTLNRINAPECETRGKVAEIVALLYTTAASVAKWMDSDSTDSPAPVPHANPTAGVRPRAPDPSLRWKPGVRRDDGHFETDGDMPVLPGLVLKSASNSPATPVGIYTAATTSSVRSTASMPDAPAPATQDQAGTLPTKPYVAGLPDQINSGVNLNPNLNGEMPSQTNASGAIDFFGSSAFPNELLDWDAWGSFFVPGMDQDFLKGPGL